MKFVDEDGRIVLRHDETGHRPYFLTTDMFDNGYPRDKYGREAVRGIEIVKKMDLFKNAQVQLRKVILANPGVTKLVSDTLTNVFEDNIKYQWCYMHDLGIVPCIDYSMDLTPNMTDVDPDRWVNLLGQPIPEIPMVAVDIEIDSDGPIVSPQDPRWPISAISFWDKNGGRCFTIRQKVSDSDTYHNTTFFNDELDMITHAIDEMGKYPVVLSFNGAQFDFLYMHWRAVKLGMLYEDTGFETHWNRSITVDGSENHIKPSKEIRWAGFRKQVHIDLFLLARNTTVQNYIFSARYKFANLNDVAKAIIGVGKYDIGGKVPSQLDTPTLIRYNLKDAELVYRIMAKDNFSFFRVLITLSRVCKMPIEDLCTWRTNKWVQCLLIWEHRKRNILIPNRLQLKEVQAQTTPIIKGKQYEGAKVIEPHKGLWFNVLVLDAASMYPTFISRKNLSYETIDSCEHPECHVNTIPYTSHWVCLKRRGIISNAIGEIRDLRVNKIKQLAKGSDHWESVSQGVKTIMNATYGVFGFKNFSLFWLPMAECITACGRDVITKLEEKLPMLGYSVLGGDTDSIFCTGRDGQIDRAISWAKADLDIDLEVDKTYRWLAISLKKNYIGLTTEDVMIVKGLQGKKVHVPPWVTRTFESLKTYMKDNIHEGQPMPVEGIKRIVTDGFNRFVGGGVPLEELTFQMTITTPHYKTETTDAKTGKVRVLKLPQHARAYTDAGNALEDVPEEGGIKVVFVKTLDGPKLIENAGQSTIDHTAYIGIYQSSMEQILEALDLKFADMVSLPELVEFIPKVKIGRKPYHKVKKVAEEKNRDIVPNVLTDILEAQGRS
jgi:DNA polymerase I